jgi:hypothetical protein
MLFSFLLISLVFFFLGRATATTEDIEKAKRFWQRHRHQGLGVVRRPTAEQVAKRGTKLEETEQAVEEALDKLVPQK